MYSGTGLILCLEKRALGRCAGRMQPENVVVPLFVTIKKAGREPCLASDETSLLFHFVFFRVFLHFVFFAVFLHFVFLHPIFLHFVFLHFIAFGRGAASVRSSKNTNRSDSERTSNQ